MIVPFIGGFLFQAVFQIIGECQNIGQCTVTIVRLDSHPADNTVKIVFIKLRVQTAGQLDGAQCRSGKINACTTKFMTQEGVVETAVVCHNQRAAQ